MDGGCRMTKTELLIRLEAISCQMDELEQMIAEKSIQNQIALNHIMNAKERKMKHSLSKLEREYEFKKTKLQQSFAIAR